MKIQQKDYYHGAALTQIVEHKSFTALNKADNKYGHYKINHDVRLLVKITSKEDSPWQFTINASDLSTIEDDMNSKDSFFLCLVCGLKTICLLDTKQIKELLDIHSNYQQWIRICETGSLRVHSAKKDLSKTVPHNAFPDKIFTT